MHRGQRIAGRISAEGGKQFSHVPRPLASGCARLRPPGVLDQAVKQRWRQQTRANFLRQEIIDASATILYLSVDRL